MVNAQDDRDERDAYVPPNQRAKFEATRHSGSVVTEAISMANESQNRRISRATSDSPPFFARMFGKDNDKQAAQQGCCSQQGALQHQRAVVINSHTISVTIMMLDRTAAQIHRRTAADFSGADRVRQRSRKRGIPTGNTWSDGVMLGGERKISTDETRDDDEQGRVKRARKKNRMLSCMPSEFADPQMASGSTANRSLSSTISATARWPDYHSPSRSHIRLFRERHH
jgi:hypothetical protein